MELTVTGFLYEAKEIETLQNGKQFKRIVIKQPSRVNQFGEKVGEENYFEVTIFGIDKINNFFENAPEKSIQEGIAKLTMICYVNGSRREYEGKTYHNIQLTYKAVKWII